ncbi:MAG: glycosyltransferase family 2 protein [Balneolaceae bacterium]
MPDKNIHNSKQIYSTPIDLSIVIPLLNEEKSIEELYRRIEEAVQDYSYEVIFVDDGSSDASWDIITSLSDKNFHIKGIRFRRNYGKSDALQAGFDEAQGRFVITMDADLQDDPFEIPAMVEMLENGEELISGWKRTRHDPITKTVPSRFFNTVTRWSTGIKLHDFNCGLKAYQKEVVKSIYLYGELHRYVPLLAKWQGFNKIAEKEVKHHPRKYGKTKFGISRFLNGFLDLITLLFVKRYMQRPMHFFGSLGIIFLILGSGVNVYLVYLKLFLGEAIGNRPLLFLGVLLVVVGVQFFSIGFLGEMLNRGQVKKQKPNISDKKGL